MPDKPPVTELIARKHVFRATFLAVLVLLALWFFLSRSI